MKTCPNCGQVSADEDRFCQMCGTAYTMVPRSPSSYRSPSLASVTPPKHTGHALRNLLILTVLVLVALILVGLFSSLKL